MTSDHLRDEGVAPTDPETGPEQAAGDAQRAAPAPAGEPGAAPETEAPDSGAPTDDETDPLEQAQAKVAAMTDDLKRLQAEYVNYKRRVERDRELVLENARFAVLSALLPVLDDLDRARDHGELEGGFKAVADSLERIVVGQGLVKFGKPGDEFDPRFHEALMHAHSPDVTTTTCQHVISAGYQIGDRVVRPAKVTVVDPQPTGQPTGQPETSGESDKPEEPGQGS